jgi:hypothetical protein
MTYEMMESHGKAERVNDLESLLDFVVDLAEDRRDEVEVELNPFDPRQDAINRFTKRLGSRQEA